VSLNAFAFEQLEEALGNGIVVAVAASNHTPKPSATVVIVIVTPGWL